MSDVKVWSAVTITDKVMQDRPCPDYFVAEGDYDALRDEVARLRGALQPFAERWEYFERTKHPSGTWPDDMEYADDEPSAIYLGQLKAAKEALAALTPQAGKGGVNG